MNHNGLTPLMWAAKRGRADLVRLLLSQGANKDARRKRGTTALYLAVQENHSKCAEALLEAGVNTEIGYDDRTPLMKAAYNARRLYRKSLNNCS